MMILQISVAEKFDKKVEEENVNNAIKIQEHLTQLSNVIGVLHASGEDNFFTPPWTSYVVFKRREGFESITNKNLYPEVVMSIRNVSEEYGPSGKHVEGGIRVQKRERCFPLVNSRTSQKFPVHL